MWRSKQRLASDFINDIEGLSILEKHSTTKGDGENGLITDSKGGTLVNSKISLENRLQECTSSPLSHTFPSLSRQSSI